jgi:hypothetical protein
VATCADPTRSTPALKSNTNIRDAGGWICFSDPIGDLAQRPPYRLILVTSISHVRHDTSKSKN